MNGLASLFFKTAVIFFLLGQILGIGMAASHSYGVAGAYAHINLLGFVACAIFGTYYALVPEKASLRLARVHFGVWVLGVLVTAPALAATVGGTGGLEPVIAVGSLIVGIGTLLFAMIVFQTH